MDKLETNVLVLGKSGVGKSTFINYIYGQDIMEQKAGKPVTGYGLHKDTFELESLLVNIYDSWGLEADKADKWQKLISDELKKHNESGKIKDWFHTIYYCFSANSARIEEFEINKIIKPLIRDNNNITFIITHYNEKKNDDKAEAMIKEITTRLNINRKNIIKVSSKESKTLGGVVKQCGREEVLESLKENLWEDIKNRIPLQYKKEVIEKVNDWREVCYNIIESEKLWKSSYIMEDVINAIKIRLKDTFNKINEISKKYIKESCLYYYMIIMNISNPQNSNVSFEEFKSIEDMIDKNRISELIDNKILINMPVLLNIKGLVGNLMFLLTGNLVIGGITLTVSKFMSIYGKKYVLQKLKRSLDDQYLEIHNQIPVLIDNLTEYLNSLDIDEILLLQDCEELA